jgi:DNA-binding SARP family transcriptional activator/tetratricopeptide (TPR) repeat protein
MEFRVLGPLDVVVGGASLGLTGLRERCLLAALLIDEGRVVPLARLVDAVWDGRPPENAGKQVRNCVSGLRRRLREAGVTTEPISSHPAGYVLTVGADVLDRDRFNALVVQGRRAASAGMLEDAVARMREALALWRGPALAGLSGRTLQAAAAGLDEQRLTVLQECLDYEVALGRGAGLVAELSTLVGEHPLRERLRAVLMRALHRSGRRTEALDVYREGRRLLVSETGLEPGQELRDLERAILTDDGPTGEACAEPVSARWAVVVERPAQLPASVPAFTGRDPELTELDELLSSAGGGTIVVSAIAGAGGVGKTALAVHWAHRVRDQFPDGQIYVDLRGYALTPPMRTIDALALLLRALGVPAERLPVDVDEATALYRSRLAGRRILVVLDNAADPDQVRPLLPGNPACVVLVTSRSSLAGLVAREGARPLALGVLSPAEAYALLVRLLGDRRVAAEPAAARDLARGCAYLPLALRIAAAHLQSRPRRRIAEYVAELRQDDGLSALAVDGDPHTAVRVTFDISYARLEPETRRLFRLMGLVPGPDVTAEAIAASADVPVADCARGLARLASAHLVDEVAAGRFGAHDLLRRYAAEVVQREESEEVRRRATERLLAWYLRTVDAAAGVLYPEILRLPDRTTGAPPVFDDATAALAWLDAERRNLVAAIQVATDHGPRRSAWLLADALRGYFHLRMSTVEWDFVAHAGAAAADLDGDVAAHAAARLSLGDLYWRISRYPAAIEHYALAATLAGQAGWDRGQGAVHGNLGNVYQQSGRLAQAAENYRAALAIAERTGWVTGQAANLDNLGAVYAEMGRLSEAAEHLEGAVRLFQANGSAFAEGVCRTNLGEVQHARGCAAEAEHQLTAALVLHRRVGNRGGEAETLRMLAVLHADGDRLGDAVDLATSALKLARDAGDRRYEADALNTLANLDHRRGHAARAADRHREALALARAIGNTYSEVEALIGLATVGPPDDARVSAEQALLVARSVGYRLLEQRAGDALAAVAPTG